jgi:Na+-transporting methylmalonyl-CoA/oxaloacetate decarboxylase gamma subunit
MEDILIDWARAVKVGVIGFGITFMVLATLAVAIWLTGFLVGRYSGERRLAVRRQAVKARNLIAVVTYHRLKPAKV